MSSFFCPNQCDRLCKNLGRPVEKEANFYDLTDEEIVLCKSEPAVCVRAYALSWEAERACLELHSKSRTNDESDACRHYVWSYQLTKNFGETLARKILSAHEANPKQDKKEREMDLHNNDVGVDDFNCDKKRNLSDEQILKKFQKNLKGKKFKILKPQNKKSGELP